MRGAPALVAVALGAVVLASGCGQQHAGTPAGPPLSGSSSSSPSATPVPYPAPSDPGTASCHSGSASRAALITITYADNGQTLCVRRGTAVQVYLRGTATNRWSAIHASNEAVLAPHANGRLMLMAGVTGASFLAAHPGTATKRRRTVGHSGVRRNHRLPRHG